jgi:hypothetical protein
MELRTQAGEGVGPIWRGASGFVLGGVELRGPAGVSGDVILAAIRESTPSCRRCFTALGPFIKRRGPVLCCLGFGGARSEHADDTPIAMPVPLG